MRPIEPVMRAVFRLKWLLFIVTGLVILILVWVRIPDLVRDKFYDTVYLPVNYIDPIQKLSSLPTYSIYGVIGEVVHTSFPISNPVTGKAIGDCSFAIKFYFQDRERGIHYLLIPLLIETGNGNFALVGGDWIEEISKAGYQYSLEGAKSYLKGVFKESRVFSVIIWNNVVDFDYFVEIIESQTGKPVDWNTNAGKAAKLARDLIEGREANILSDKLQPNVDGEVVIPMGFSSKVYKHNSSVNFPVWLRMYIRSY